MNNKKKKSSRSPSRKSKAGVIDFALPRVKTLMPDVGATQKYFVLGKRATSYEWNVAQALENVGLEYSFQMDMLGGRSLPGGFVLDFLVRTTPLPTPVYVNGDYWHRDPQRDYMQQVVLSQYSSSFAQVVTFWGIDCATLEAAYRSVRSTFV